MTTAIELFYKKHKKPKKPVLSKIQFWWSKHPYITPSNKG